jgi:hypothetical protein
VSYGELSRALPGHHQVRTQGLVGRVRSRASLGEGWRLYAPAAHVGLGCETKHNVIEKTSFSNGKFT